MSYAEAYSASRQRAAEESLRRELLATFYTPTAPEVREAFCGVVTKCNATTGLYRVKRSRGYGSTVARTGAVEVTVIGGVHGWHDVGEAVLVAPISGSPRWYIVDKIAGMASHEAPSQSELAATQDPAPVRTRCEDVIT
ncbi:MAG: hypothetical protein AMXMBFR13_30610 [Phycisphaerae bacterium]